MSALVRGLELLGDIAPTHELLASGFSPGDLYYAAKRGEVFRPRKGWYASRSLSAEAVRAWRVGGRLTCVSAAVEHGLWVPDFEGLHVEVPHSAARLRAPGDRRTRLSALDQQGTVVHWRSTASTGSRVSVSVAAAVHQVFQCCGDEVGFVVLESALHLGKLNHGELNQLIDSLPRQSQPLARRANHLSDSGSESEVKLMLFRLGIPFRQQIVIGRWPVDFLVGEHLAIEADSKAHHSNPYRDRQKDAELSAAHVRVLRFMYSQIHFEQSVVELAILSALARGDAHSA
jgi:very-short-patch-repair endonuclease